MVSDVDLLPRKVPTQPRAIATVDALVEATARILVDDGLHGISTNRIAEVAGVSVGSLYQYFPSKEALVMAVVERHAARVVGLLSEAFAVALQEPLPVAIEQLVGSIVDVHEQQPALQHAIVSQVMTLGVHHTAPMHARAVDVVHAFLLSRQEQLLVTDCRSAAWMLVTTVMATLHGRHMGVTPDMGTTAVKAELTALIIRYLLPSAQS